MCHPHLQAVGREGNGSRIKFGVLKLLHTLAAARTPKPKRPVEAASHHELAIGRESGTSDVVRVAHKVGAKALAGGHVQQLHLRGWASDHNSQSGKQGREMCNALSTSVAHSSGTQQSPHSMPLALQPMEVSKIRPSWENMARRTPSSSSGSGAGSCRRQRPDSNAL